jgi:hypothetical protein
MTTTTETRTQAPGKGLPAGFPFAGMLSGTKELESASKQMLQSWKQQLDTGLKMIDAVVQGAMEMRTSQLAAAADTHNRDLDAEKSVMGAKTISDLLLIQLNWMTANMERSMAYWNQMFQAAAEANAKLGEYLREYEASAGGEQKKTGAQ